MSFSSLVVSLLLAAAGDGPPPGTHLTYRGAMVAAKEDGLPSKKSIELNLLVAVDEGGSGKLLWTLEETGRGKWSWLDHFGTWSADAKKRDDDGLGPALLYQREDGKSVVPLFPPLFAAEAKLERGSAWSEGRTDFRVTGEAKVAERECQEIDSRTPYGHKRTIFVEKSSPLVVALRETVFIGQGQQHELKLELVSARQMPAEEAAKVQAAFELGTRLKESLRFKPRTDLVEFEKEELAVLRTELPKLAEAAKETQLAPLVAIAQKDLQDQKGRSGAVAALRDAAVGKPAGKFKLLDLAGKEVSEEVLKDKVTVLHFWAYRDTPLEEPYGQIGYLDFLLRKQGKNGVQVLGVLMDEKISDEAARRAAASSARKLKSFMNLSYEILMDDGTLLKQFGDPRPAGAKLPLFVVIGRDGKILEYHAGLYDVQPQQGLVELDGVVGKAAEKK
ncbi:MAG TPA: TlpA disulfide reductase family protein [bacterium]|nr:TlpA disulfide reductase family protein [bacterium]